MTVKDLRAALADAPDDLPVYGHWDMMPSFALTRVAVCQQAVVLDVDSWPMKRAEFEVLCEKEHGAVLTIRP